MASAPAPARRAGTDGLRRELGLGDTLALVVGSVLGAGIFAGAGEVAAVLPHPGWLLAAWAAGGAISLVGALVYAEMAAALPHAGGNYVYLSEAYHPAVGFLAGWGTFFVIQAGTVATLAVAVATHLEPWGVGPYRVPWVALAAIALSSALNYRGTLVGARVQTVTTIAKVLAIAVFVAAVPLALRVGPAAAPAAMPPIGARAFALALIPILFAYLGWNAPVYVAGEVRDPGRTLPRAILGGTLASVALYLAVNATYLAAVPVARLAGDPHVAATVATELFGARGAVLVAGMVLLSIAGCLHATVILGPRIVYRMARDGLFAEWLAATHVRHGTPHRAILAQAVVATVLVAGWGTFTHLLTYTTFAIVLVATLDAGAIYLLRWRRPDLPRPYRVWGYPWVPLVYVLANAWLVAATLAVRPAEALAVVAIVATGLPVYVWYARRRRQPIGPL